MNSLAQSMAALDIGNQIRGRRAEVKRQIADQPCGESRRRAVEVLSDPEPACEGMSAYHLLVACRRVGPAKATSILVRAGVPQHKRLSEMTGRQKGALAGLLLRDVVEVAA